MRGRWERTPSAYLFLIVLFLLEYSSGGSVEERGLTRYKHGGGGGWLEEFDEWVVLGVLSVVCSTLTFYELACLSLFFV